MLKSVTLKFTETGEVVLPVKGITIFVGSNNAGKSLVLREIEQAFLVHPFPTDLRILADYEVEWPTIEAVNEAIEKAKPYQNVGMSISQLMLGRLNPSGGREVGHIDKNSLFITVQNKSDKNWLATQFLRWGVIRLDGRSRFNLTNDQTGGDLLGPPQNVLAHLFQDDAARFKVRSLVKDAFGFNFVIDPTNLGQLRIRLSADEPLADEQSLNTEARDFHRKALHIKDASDGVQAFTGIVSAVRSGEYHTVLVDEPEAFLHPPLARKLGRDLAALAGEREGALMASTHSADFLMGCVEASASVRVVRLEYNSGKSRARMINAEALQRFLKRPLVRSTNVVSGLFHDGVVVLESDNDRAFYSEIYYRLSAEKTNYPSILFVNAQNKQTIKDIIGPLRQFGVPAAAAPDIDFIKDGGATWTDWLKSAQIPDALHLGYGQLRSAIYSALQATGKNMKSDGGINILDLTDKLAAEQLFQNLEEYGVFPVRQGELESWLMDLGVPGKKTDWTVSMLERLGSDPANEHYIRPQSGDVWSYMENIVRWIQDPGRKGMHLTLAG